MASSLRSGLALVDAGWTGAVTVTIGAVVAAVQPQGRMSAAGVWMYLLQECRRIHGGTWAGYVDSADKLYITSDTAAFALAATSVTQTRLGLTGTYTGATAYTADVAHYGAVTPSLGLMLDAGDASVSGMPPGASGALGAGGAWAAEGGTLACFGTIAELVALEVTLLAAEVYDVWLEGRHQGRVHLGNISRARWGSHGNRATLNCSVTGVR